MTRTITTAAELDALPVKVVLLDEGGWPVWRDPHTGWCASNGTRGIPADLLIADGAPLTVLHDPSAPAPAPSAATARHERAVAYADDVAEGGAPVPDDYERHYCTDDGEDWPCGAARAARVPEAAVEAERTAARLHSTTEPPPHENGEVCCGECGEAIAYPGCTAEETSERAWRHAYRAALTAALPFLTAAPSATRDEVAEALGVVWDDGNGTGLDGWVGPGRGAGEVDHEAVRARDRAVDRALRVIAAAPSATRDEVARTWHEAAPEYGPGAWDRASERARERSLHRADALLAHFNITPKEDQ